MRKSEFDQTNSFTDQQKAMIGFLELGLSYKEMEEKADNKEVTLKQRRLAIVKKIEQVQRDIRWLRDIGLIKIENNDIQIFYEKLKASNKWE